MKKKKMFTHYELSYVLFTFFFVYKNSFKKVKGNWVNRRDFLLLISTGVNIIVTLDGFIYSQKITSFL